MPKLDDIKYRSMVSRQETYPQVSLSVFEFDWLIEQAEKLVSLESAFNNTSMRDEEFVEFVGGIFDNRTRD